MSLENWYLPPPSIPRPGDRVTWFQDSLKISGRLIGHSVDGEPIVHDDFGGCTTVGSYERIRLEDPRAGLGPNWHRLPGGAKVVIPKKTERQAFQQLLSQRTPPGPQYLDLITEIWARGHEVFVVGGTVRDVVSRSPSKDVDLVTSMPLIRLLPLIQSMYRRPRKLEWEAKTNGHLRLGGAPGTGDPFIDLCLFKHSKPGTDQAVFGDDFGHDMAHRDFACNSIYFDPISEVLVDPSGEGINDAENKTLRLVCDNRMRSAYHLGQLSIRFFKFCCRGFAAAGDCAQVIASNLEPSLQAMPSGNRASYIRTQVLSKYDTAEHDQRFEEFHSQFVEFGAGELWDRYVEPHRGDILNDK